MRTAIYIRVSSEEQAEEGYSIPAQAKALRKYAQQQGWEVVAEFVEEGVSGRTDDRPQFQAMVKAARQRPRPFDLVLVHKMDRFARNRQHSVVYKALFRRELGIDVRSMTEQFEDSPAGRFHEAIMEALAEFYSENLATEVLKGQRERASTGRGMCVPPIGYTRCCDRADAARYGRYIPDPETAPIVQWIFTSYAGGEMGMASIARRLSQEGAIRFGPAASRYTWTASFVHKILTNRAYIGELVWGQRDTRNQRRLRPEEEWVVVPDAHEPLVDQETWELCTAVRTGRGKANLPRENRDYLLRGLLRCLDCGRNMIHFNYQWADRKTGQRIYRPSAICTGYTRYHRCYCNRVALADIESAVFEQLRAITSGHFTQNNLVILPEEKTKPEPDPVSELRKRLAIEERKHQRAWQAYKADVISLLDYKREKEQYETIRATLEAEIAQVTTAQDRSMVDIDSVRGAIATMIRTANDEELSFPWRKRALEAIIHSVHVSREQRLIEIWFQL
ncbi:MAG: recombinase family protein [Bacillota bacterium]